MPENAPPSANTDPFSSIPLVAPSTPQTTPSPAPLSSTATKDPFEQTIPPLPPVTDSPQNPQVHLNHLGGYNPTSFISKSNDLQINTGNTSPDSSSSIEVTPPVIEHQNEKSGGHPLMIGILSLIFIIIAFTLAGAYTITYGIIKINNPKISDPISNFVQSIPFTPKTAKYLISRTVISQKLIDKESFDLSLAVKSQQLSSYLETDSIEMAAKGDVDFSDLENIKMSMNASITKDFNVDFISIDNKIYFHINKVPLTIFASMGLGENDVDPLTKDWIFYDATPLDTEANKILEEKNESQNADNLQKIQNIVFDDKILDKIVITKDKLDETPVYKLQFNVDPDTLDYIESSIEIQFPETATSSGSKKASELIKNLQIEAWIEDSTYNLRKLNSSFTFVGSPSSKNSLEYSNDVAFSYSLSNIGQEIVVSPPSGAISLEKFLIRMQQLIANKYAQDQSMINPSAPVLAQPTSAPPKNFISAGQQTIEPDVTLNINSVVSDNKTVSLKTTFGNNSTTKKVVAPLRLQMHSTTQGTADKYAPLTLSLDQGTVSSQNYSFEILPNPPFTFVYLNSAGNSIILGTYNPTVQ